MSRRWDVVVAGAGIHGAGMAQAVAAAGHSVLVLEQDAIAAGSSSRSSKLIHGGLRYLESGQFRLVRESLHERALMLRLAPELVRLQKFFIFQSTTMAVDAPGSCTWDSRSTRCSPGWTPRPATERCRATNGQRLDGLETKGLRAGVPLSRRAD